MRAVLLLLVLIGAPALARDDELEACVRALDGAREPGWTKAFERLSQIGAPAAERVLADFERADHAARRARARLLLEIPAAQHCARVLGLIADPDPEVRREFARWLGDPALAEASAAERVQVLERLAGSDPDGAVRAQASASLADCSLPEAIPALERLMASLPPAEALPAAEALARLPEARARLLALVTAAFDEGREPPREGVLAVLMGGYGRALAAVPGGGLVPRERLPFLRCRAHPAPEVQAAARLALANFVARCAELVEPERADQVLARLGQEGWPPEECLRRRIDLAWLERGDPAGALELARALERVAQGFAPEEAEDWETHARFFQGAAQFALGELDAADALFAALVARLEAAHARRTDLFPSPAAEEPTPPLAEAGFAGAEEHGAPRAERTEAGGAVRVGELELLAIAHQWRALILLARGQGPEVLAELRAAHERFLEARVVAECSGAPDPVSLDALFDRDLSPYTLVLFNDKLAPAGRGRALDQALALAADWATVAPLELFGFAARPGVERRVSDVFSDPERLAHLRALRAAESGRYRRLDDRLRSESAAALDPDRRMYLHKVWTLQSQESEDADNQEREALQGSGASALSPEALQAVFDHLARYLVPSMHALNLANELRSEGRSAEARAIAERALATLRTTPGGRSSVWAEWNSARFELLRGSTFMDEDRPREAEDACLAAVRRLEAIERSVQEQDGGASGPEATRQRDGQVQIVRKMRGEALLSLAVNANVRFHDTARALEYFERAYDLDQSAFMALLRACYRARSGKADEARTVLRGVVPVPSLYYNLACTHALLGDKELALDFLERDFRDNYPTQGSRARQREWARKDPDLASLRGEPRFARLLGEGAGAAEDAR